MRDGVGGRDRSGGGVPSGRPAGGLQSGRGLWLSAGAQWVTSPPPPRRRALPAGAVRPGSAVSDRMSVDHPPGGRASCLGETASRPTAGGPGERPRGERRRRAAARVSGAGGGGQLVRGRRGTWWCGAARRATDRRGTPAAGRWRNRGAGQLVCARAGGRGRLAPRCRGPRDVAGGSAGGPRDRQRCRGARRDRGRPAIAVIKKKKRKKERKSKTYHGPSTRTDRRMHLDWRVDRAICRSILPNLVGRHERSTTTDPETFSYSAMTAVRLRLYRLS